jgi:nucleoside-diphosphate-sugar epimerase
MQIQNIAELEDVLSRPYEEDIAAMRDLDGDLLLLGVAGKMGPSLALRAVRAMREAGSKGRVIGVSRFSNPAARTLLDEAGVETIAADLLRPEELNALPEAPNVIYLAARKFGSTGDEGLTWAMNTWLPAQVAQRYRQSRIVAFSSGNVYPLVPVESGGATEDTLPGPVGEYAQSVLGRERMFEHFSKENGTPAVLLRLNYAVELRYGVLVDVGRKVLERVPVDASMGYANVIWQGDANSVCLRSFGICDSPPAILNLTGPEILSVREIAEEFGRRFGVEPVIEGTEAKTALLNNAARCTGRFGPPRVSVVPMLAWIADWLRRGGESWNKPTHFETRDGKF